MMKKFFLPVFLLVLAAHAGAEAEDVIAQGDVLTLERCIETGLQYNPNVVAARNTLRANKARVGQAESGYYPQIDLSAGYSRVSPADSSSRTSVSSVLSGDISGSGTSLSASSFDSGPFDQYSSSISLRQLLFDFWKTKTAVNISDLDFHSSSADLDAIVNEVVLNVKQSYYGVLKAERNRDVAIETVSQFSRHLEQAKGFYEVGTRPKFDVTKAEVDLSNAKLGLIRAENALKLAKAALDDAMGVPGAPDYVLEDNLSFVKHQITFGEALEKAYQNRPDLQSLIFRKRASEQTIELSKKDYYPVLTGSAAYLFTGEKFPLEESWRAGVTLTFPVFSGFLTKYRVEESRAGLEVLSANEKTLRQAVFLEVRQAYLNLHEAEERIVVSELTVGQAEENLEIANGRYAAGVGNPIEVTDAEVILSNAKTSHIEALYDYKVAIAHLEKAMGTGK